MTPPLPNPRYEKKFIAEGFTLPEVLAGVRRHRAAFREAYPPRVVNNLYLDSPTRRDYHAHINGAADRSKTRVRWYGPQFETVERPMLERKLKRGMVSGKEAHALGGVPINEGSLRARLDAAFEAASIPPMLRSALRHLEPALFNRFQRYYFVSGDGALRLTLDFGLQFAGVTYQRPKAINLSPPARTLILELKFGPESALDADVVTNSFPFRVARFSKYIVGVQQS
jgi:VTC domain